MIRGVVLALWLVGIGAAQAAEPSVVFNDGRDAWTLLDRKLMNRQLFEQLEVGEQSFRLGRDLGIAAAATDAALGGQLAPGQSELTRFHGYTFLDNYLALRAFDGLDLNLNLTLTNPSASDGYRVSDQLFAGVALHLHFELFTLAGDPVRFDFVGLDQDLVTIGQGLLLEEVPLEGHSAALTWKGLQLREVFGGRTLWYDDDIIAVSLGLADRRVEAYWARWLQQAAEEGSPVVLADAGVPQADSFVDYFGLVGEISPWERVRIAGEYAGRRRNRRLKNAFLVRADFLDRSLGPVELHVGYQLRFYQRFFGPKEDLVTPTTVPNVPYREDSYVTNSFEFYGASPYYDQWSQTGMLEARWHALSQLVLFFYGELFWRQISDPRKGPKRVVYLQRFGRAPGRGIEYYYRGGLELYPWSDQPHRVRGYLSNKLVASGRLSVFPDSRRFTHDPLLVFELEVFL